jgi:hypothetical protein
VQRFLSLSAVVIMLAALTPAYVPAMSNEFGATHVNAIKYKVERCKYCGQTRKEATSKCPSSSNGNHSFHYDSEPSK